VERARAAGIEDLVGGAIATGRGASVGQTADFLATAHHPANLAVLPGMEGGFELRLPILQACFDRAADPTAQYRTPGMYEGFEGGESFQEVCNESTPILAGNIGFAQAFRKGWGYGIGIFTPAGVGNTAYGDDTIVSVRPAVDEKFTPTLTGVESPARYLAVERTGINAFLMAGVGVSLAKMLRVGASVGYGVASINSKSVVSVRGGSFQDAEVLNEINAYSWFVPKAVASVVLSPWEQVELFGVFTYHGDIKAKGTADLTANGVKGAPLKSCTDKTPGTHCRIEGVELTIPFPTFEAVGGVRFSSLRRARKGKLDPMRDERFDIELEAIWTQTSNVDEFKVNLHDTGGDDPNIPRIQFGNSDMAAFSYIRNRTSIPKYWKDTLSLRGGADLQVVPERFVIRGGVSWASRAQPIEYMSVDYWPVEKIGIHGGATLAAGRFRVSVGYAHFMYESITVPLGQGRVRDIVSIDIDKANAVNEGNYRAAQNVFSLQVDAAF
jgi:hypothetical protein